MVEVIKKVKPVESAPKTLVRAPSNIDVVNISSNNVCLESGVLAPNETGLATLAEVSNLSGKYLEVV